MATARAYLFSSVVLLAGLAPVLLPGNARPVSITASSARSSDFNPKSVRVYVSLFDINAASGKEPAAVTPAPAPQKPPPGAQASGESPHVLQDGETSSKQADRLKAFFGDALVQTLQKNGFNATPQGSSRPEKGVLLKGVFAEVDSQNHNCLGVLGGTTPAPKFVLYVGVYNLARPDQPLYRVMTMENCDAHYGPVISLNNYIPMDKYEISKSPTEEEVRKICAQIVANLKALLSVNSAAFSD
ncbi:MAG TPA: hypothetical protein VJY15_26615 [Candidatus Acidoferrum sp.]|nr:hypothetical protein [Candidatus Acidoferrum sp.]